MRLTRSVLLIAIASVGTLQFPHTALAARDIDRFVSGSWYNPAQNGHGPESDRRLAEKAQAATRRAGG